MLGDAQVVNGVVASPFALTHHVPHAFYSILRAAYTIAPSLMQVGPHQSGTHFHLLPRETLVLMYGPTNVVMQYKATQALVTSAGVVADAAIYIMS